MKIKFLMINILSHVSIPLSREREGVASRKRCPQLLVFGLFPGPHWSWLSPWCPLMAQAMKPMDSWFSMSTKEMTSLGAVVAHG